MGDRGDDDHVMRVTPHPNSSLCTIGFVRLQSFYLLKYMHNVEKIYECDSLSFLQEMTCSGSLKNVVLPYLYLYKWYVNL